jgi:hypothetical protein
MRRQQAAEQPPGAVLLHVIAALAVLVPLAAACGGGGEADRSPAATQSPTPTSAPDATPTGPIDLSTSAPATTVYASDSDDFAGGSIASGDFNGDGLADLLLGAPMGDGPDSSREDAGEAYVVLGRTTRPASVDLAKGEQDVTLYGAALGDNLGTSALAADLNGDDIDDIIVGAPGVTVPPDPRTDQGRAYVYFGSADLAGTLDTAEETFDFVVTGAEGFSRLGHALASGDVSGDGVADLVLGAPFAGREVGTPPGSQRKEAGEAYVVFGSPTLAGEVNIAFDEPDFMVSAEQRFAQFGGSVASGDVNDDGVEDVIVGAPQADGEEREAAGAVYVFFGGDDLSGRRFIAAGEQDATFLGGRADDAFGMPLASGDVNGDGIDDIVAGARTSDGPDDARAESGDVSVLFGGPGLAGTSDLAETAAGATVYGSGPGHLIPNALALGDLDGDGLADITLATTTGHVDRFAAGAVYVIAGAGLEGPRDLADPAVVGAEADDQLGSALIVIPDDDEPTLAVLARGADGPDNGRSEAGEVYLIGLP